LASGVNTTLLPTSATVPCVGFCTEVIVSVSPSGSVSLASSVATGIVSGVSSSVCAVSFTVTGLPLITLTATEAVSSVPPELTV